MSLGLRDHLTHRGNLRTSRFGWLRLTPMYSVHLVEQILDEDIASGLTRVLDPYCGTGTTALVCAQRGIPADTTDINPFLLWLAEVKTRSYRPEEIAEVIGFSAPVELALGDAGRGTEWVPPLSGIEKWWDEATLAELSRAWSAISAGRGRLTRAAADLLTVAFLRVVIKTAAVSFGHQSMSFRKREAGPPPGALFELSAPVRPNALSEWRDALDLVARAASAEIALEPRVLPCDARDLARGLPASKYDCVITSPPYCNRMSYIRELRPYMFWLGQLRDGRDAGELDWKAIGGTWGVATSRIGKWAPAASDPDVPFDGFEGIVDAVAVSSDLLARYVRKYFVDMTLHVSELARVLAPGARAHYIVGNSKFYDTVVPTEEILASIFSSAGFSDVDIRVLRKRTSKKELYEFLVSATWR